MAEEWVDHALSKFREDENKLAQTVKAQADAEKKYKVSLFHLAEVKKGCKNAEAVVSGFEMQAKELRASLKKAEMQLALAIKQTKL